MRLLLFPLIFPIAVVGVKRGKWSTGYAAELCGLGYFSFVRVCRLFRVKLFSAMLDDVDMLYQGRKEEE